MTKEYSSYKAFLFALSHSHVILKQVYVYLRGTWADFALLNLYYISYDFKSKNNRAVKRLQLIKINHN